MAEKCLKCKVDCLTAVPHMPRPPLHMMERERIAEDRRSGLVRLLFGGGTKRVWEYAFVCPSCSQSYLALGWTMTRSWSTYEQYQSWWDDNCMRVRARQSADYD